PPLALDRPSGTDSYRRYRHEISRSAGCTVSLARRLPGGHHAPDGLERPRPGAGDASSRSRLALEVARRAGRSHCVVGPTRKPAPKPSLMKLFKLLSQG